MRTRLYLRSTLRLTVSVGLCAFPFLTAVAHAQSQQPPTAPREKPAPSAGDTTGDVPLPNTPPPTDTAPTGTAPDETPPVTPAPDDGTAPLEEPGVVVPMEDSTSSEATSSEATSSEATSSEATSSEGQPGDATRIPATDDDDEAAWLELHEDEEDDEREKKHRMPRYSAMLLVEGTAKYGAYSRVIDPAADDIGDDDPETDTSRAGQFGGQVTVGIMPGGSAFAMAARMKGGSYVGPEVPHGFLGAEMLFGANFARNAQGTSFTYILGGIGVEYLPGINEDMLSLSATGGTVVNGIDFGGSLSIAANDDIAMALIGMQVGWGRLF